MCLQPPRRDELSDLTIPTMDQETFDALRNVMAFARKYGADEVSADFQHVLDWMSEVRKEYDE